MASRSRTDRARRSGFVAISTSPSRTNRNASSSFGRLPVALSCERLSLLFPLLHLTRVSCLFVGREPLCKWQNRPPCRNKPFPPLRAPPRTRFLRLIFFGEWY